MQIVKKGLSFVVRKKGPDFDCATVATEGDVVGDWPLGFMHVHPRPIPVTAPLLWVAGGVVPHEFDHLFGQRQDLEYLATVAVPIQRPFQAK